MELLALFIIPIMFLLALIINKITVKTILKNLTENTEFEPNTVYYLPLSKKGISSNFFTIYRNYSEPLLLEQLKFTTYKFTVDDTFSIYQNCNKSDLIITSQFIDKSIVCTVRNDLLNTSIEIVSII